MSAAYYSDPWVDLYLGDCLEVREWLAADVLVTDPPYGIGFRPRFAGSFGDMGSRDRNEDRVAGDRTTDARDAAMLAWGAPRPWLMFGSWREPVLAAHTRIVWDKRVPGKGNWASPWAPCLDDIYVGGAWGWSGARDSSVLSVQQYVPGESTRPDHPTPKPVSLMQALIAKCPPGVIADPFAGSGSTLVAAKALGRKAIGVELEERYCEIAARRLSQDVLDFGGATS